MTSSTSQSDPHSRLPDHAQGLPCHVPYSSWSELGSDLQMSCREPALDLEAREFSGSRWRAVAAVRLLRQLRPGRAVPTGEPWLSTLGTSSSSFSSLGAGTAVVDSFIMVQNA